MQVKSEWGSFPDTPRLEFEVTNQNGQFSTLGERSLLKGVVLQNTSVQVIQTQGTSEILEWEGVIENAIENHRTQRVKIIGISPLSKDLDSPALLTLGGDEAITPARLSELVFIAFDIPVDSASYAKADDFLSTLVSAQIDPNLLESRVTLMELQKQLATAGYGRIYYFDGKMRYEVFQTLSPTITTNLTDRDLMTHPEVITEERASKPYKVEHLFGSVESAGFVSGQAVQTLDFGPNATVKLTSESSAISVADNWEQIDKLQLRRVPFAVKHNLGAILNLDSFITLTWKRGGFIDETLEVVSIDRTDPRYTKLITRTLP